MLNVVPRWSAERFGELAAEQMIAAVLPSES
jgi:hypothetical protein